MRCDHLLIEKDGYHIGDQITVVPPGKGEKLSDTLTESTFTIVGVAASPEYFATTRDTTSVGTGQTDAFVFLSPEVLRVISTAQFTLRWMVRLQNRPIQMIMKPWLTR